MRTLDTSACTTTIGFPPKQGTWDFLQLAYTEGINAAIIGLIGSSYSTSTVYMLYEYSTYTSSGTIGGGETEEVISTIAVVFYNGEFFLLPSSGEITEPLSPNVRVINLATSNFLSPAADPVVFTDGTSRYVHKIRQAGYGVGLSGSGTLSGTTASDVNNMVYIGATANFSGRLNGTSVAFNADNTYVKTGAATSANTIGLNYAGARIGAQATIVGVVTAGNTISIPVTSPDVNYVKAGSLTAPAGAGYCFITITYLGNSGGNYTLTEISYDV